MTLGLPLSAYEFDIKENLQKSIYVKSQNFRDVSIVCYQ